MARVPDPRPRAPDNSPLLSAARVLDWRRSLGRAATADIPRSVVLTHQRAISPVRRGVFWRRPQQGGSFDVSPLGNERENVALVTCPGVGAPGTAVAIEELALLGVKRIVALNVAGSITASLESGSVVLVDSALCGDGTSPHYSPELVATPGTSLRDALEQELHGRGVPFSRGIAWSTDAIYRETPALLAASRERGAVVADMETAAILSVCGALGIEAAVLLVVADVTTDVWRPPPDIAGIHATLRALLPIATACLAR